MACLLVGSALTAWGCGSGDIGSDGDGGKGAGNSSGSAQGGNNSGNGGNFLATTGAGGNGTGGDSSCAAVSQEADLVSRPVDIIFVIDNSGSMGDEIEEVEEQINANFANIINSAVPPIDYRVIMVAGFGKYQDWEICVSQPLGGIPDANMDGHCDSIPSAPVETMNFYHFDQPVYSHDSLCKLLQYYGQADSEGNHPAGWGSLLRQEAFKFIVEISDDGISCSYNGQNYNDGNNANSGQAVAMQFDQALRALDPGQFGVDEMSRNYSFWSIISQQEYMAGGMNPLGLPVPPTEPITTAECNPNLNPNKPGGNPVDPGTGYQALSIMTGGYRYPTCALDYTDIFTLMAQGVIDGAQVSCEFEIPDPPPGEELDLETVEVIYSSNDNPVATYTKVDSAAQCTPTSFYIANDTITLCPDACAVVQADENAKIDLRFDCKQIVE